MKNLLLLAVMLCLLQSSSQGQTLTVHEWGTFTTLHGSTGGSLSGLYFEEEQLPPFVYHFPGFAPDSNIPQTGYRPCLDVTVKMETPVLYFYSNIERQVQVHVDFPMGTISQWYPNRSGGEETPVGVMDFDQKRTGAIDWNATVLSPTTTEKLTQQNVSAFHKWTDPRNTTSNLVKTDNGEIEKYLFYRGLANFALPLEVQFKDSMHLAITNTSSLDLPFIYIYDHTSSGAAGIWGVGPLKSGETKLFLYPKHFYGEDAHIFENDTFAVALQQAGLTKLEAQAMLNTWQDGYFQTLGFKIFWIVPRQLTDQILPIHITPSPDTLQRVLVGKTEILTPAFERQLLADHQAGRMANYKGDRYRLAYEERAEQLQKAYDSLPKPLTVHEVGSFAALCGSSGGALSGFTLEEPTLPEFVHHLPGFSPDPILKTISNATIRIETPVMYFYSQVQRDLQVEVDLQHGSIPQWFPDRASGELSSGSDTINFQQDRRGAVQWHATVLPKNTELRYSEQSGFTSKWLNQRETDANLIKNDGGEVEGYLYYNGLGNFSLPLSVRFVDSFSFAVTNTSDWDIPYLYIYDNSQPYPRFRGSGPLLHNSTRIFYTYGAEAFESSNEYLNALEAGGITEKEASVLLNNAADYQPPTSTIKIFWIAPRPLTDQILPLWINPWPDTLSRVFLGKSEILTPSFEQQLLDYYSKYHNLDKWNGDQLYEAYLQRVLQLYKPTADVQAGESTRDVLISPNPTSTTVHIHNTTDISSLQLMNVLGQTIFEQKNLHGRDFILDLSRFAAGTYYIRFSSGNSVVMKAIIKN